MRLWTFFVCMTANIGFVGQLLIADPASNVTAHMPADSTAPDKDGKLFDPKAYGARGDGMTDDTAAFASAVTAAIAAHGTVQIPAGTFLATISVTKGGITIQGAGKDATIIKAPRYHSCQARVLAVANSDGTTIKDLTIDGNKAERSSQKPIAYALLLFQSSDCTVENVRVTNAEQIGIGLSASKRAKVSKCDVDGSGWQNITTLKQ